MIIGLSGESEAKECLLSLVVRAARRFARETPGCQKVSELADHSAKKQRKTRAACIVFDAAARVVSAAYSVAETAS
jgi:hypothetical protein